MARTGRVGRDFVDLVSDARDILRQALALLGSKRTSRSFLRRFDQVRSVQQALNAVSSVRRIIPLYDMDDTDLRIYTTQGFDEKVRTLLDGANDSLVELLQVLREGRDIETTRSDRARREVEKAVRHLREFGNTLDTGVLPQQDMEPEPEPPKRRWGS